MEKKQIKRPQSQQTNTVSLKDVYSMCRHRWWWFAISVVVCMVIATFHLLTTPKQYVREASVMIKEDNQRSTRSFASQLNNMGSMGMFSSTSDVNNELLCMKSPAIMLEVVKRLHLDYNYAKKGFFQNQTLYGETLPITTSIAGLDDMQGVSFTITLKGNNFEVTKLSTAKKGKKIESDAPIKGTVGQTIKTPAGMLTVLPTAYYRAATKELEILVSRAPISSAAGGCRGKFNATINNKLAAVIDMTYMDVNTQRAEDVLNTVIAVYNENWVKDKNQIAVSTSEFINERLKVIEQELGHVDSDISSYKSRNLLPDVQASTAMAMEETAKSGSLARNYSNQLYMVRYLTNYLKSYGNSTQPLPINTGIEDSGIERQLAAYNDLLLQRNRISANSSDDNAMVQDMDQQLAGMRVALVGSLENVTTSLEAMVRSEQGNISLNSGKMSQSPLRAKDLLSVERQQKVKESLYLFLLQKREENELNQAFTAYNTRIITPPMGSPVAVSPQKPKVYGSALLIGLLIPFLFIYVREMFNTKVRGKKDLEKLTVPYIGEIPQYRKKKLKKGEEEYQMVVKPRERNVINEAFRVVRTNLEFMTNNAGADTKVIMTTSCNPGSGKTFLGANIAASLALKGDKTLIIDLDLRRASMAAYANNASKGVTDYLTGKVENCPVLPVEDSENLFIIPAGTIPPNPTEMLFNKKLDDLFAKLREEYDYILIDCPPVDIVADTSIISKWADMTIFVVRADLLERDMLPNIEQYYQDKKFKNMAILLNGTTSGHGSYGYHYGYGAYGKNGYGYGYGSK